MNHKMDEEMIRLVELGYSFSGTLLKSDKRYDETTFYKEYTLFYNDEEVLSRTAGYAEVFSFTDMVEEYKSIRREKILTELGI